MIDVKLNQQWLDDEMPFAFEYARQEQRQTVKVKAVKLSDEAKRKQKELLNKWDF